jgi:cellulose synthase/poly-beta-1,6-N-acetylglucosamine synthase-like glycosyltransferase
MGSNAPFWALPAYLFVSLAVLWYLGAILLAALYQHVLYPRWHKRRYDPAYRPRCSLIVPCKGTPRHLQENLAAYLRQDYARYEVILSVEAESDPAVPIIRAAIAACRGITAGSSGTTAGSRDTTAGSKDATAGSPRASLVIAGLASTCAQKVHNQLAALQHVDLPEVLVFADSDIQPVRGWLSQLVLPLSDPSVSIASGFYWLSPRQGTRANRTLGELVHCQMNRLMYTLFVSSMPWGGLGVWGGAMAMRKTDFETLRIASRWRECVVDDMSLAEIAVRRKLRTVLVPQCVTRTDDAKRTIAGSADWFARQLMLVKVHGWGLWASIIGFCCAYLAVSALLPISVLGALLTPASFWEWGGGAALLLIAGEMIAVLLYTLLGPTSDLALVTFLAPMLRYAQWVSMAKTIFNWTIHWSGVHYTMDRRGRVVRIER